MNTTIDLTAIATSRVPGLCWDPVHGLYRCPTCRRPPQNLRLGADAVFLCPDCATYWPTTERHGIWDHDATTAEHRDHGCLDHPAPAGRAGAATTLQRDHRAPAA